VVNANSRGANPGFVTVGRGLCSDDNLGVNGGVRPTNRLLHRTLLFDLRGLCEGENGIKAVSIPLARIDIGSHINGATSFLYAIYGRLFCCRGS
jgi:hypothetical protein